MLNKSQEENSKMVKYMRGQLNLAVSNESEGKECVNESVNTDTTVCRNEIGNMNENLSVRNSGKRKGKQSVRRVKRSKCDASGTSEELEGSSELKAKAAEQGEGSQLQERLRELSGLKWHHRLNHASKKYLEVAAKVMPELKGVQFGMSLLDCSYCKIAKAKRKPCSSQRHRPDQPFHRL